ncbi:50S ribosomal protein L10 [Candidatus Woesearchaeota archaeon]|nr:50S ribosomal protein L10 [Candidatus Woesearchaeota archaeon]
MYTPKVAEYKVARVEELASLISEYPLVGIINMENIPGPQLQRMRAKLRSSMLLTMSKKKLIDRALDKAELEKKNVSELKKYTRGMPCLVLTKENPFKLASTLKKSRTAAPAKPGQQAPRDIVIPAGPTQFAPGPIISELSAVGLKTGVEGGKVAIRQDFTIVAEGEKISKKVSDVLTKLSIMPMEIGLDIVAIYEKGVIYTRDVLSVDEEQYIRNIRIAASEANSLAVHIAYPAGETIKALIARAYNTAKAIAITKGIMSDALASKLITEAERGAEAIKSRLPQELAREITTKLSDEEEIDSKIEQLKHEREMGEIRKVESIAKEVLTKGRVEKKADEEEFFDEVKKKMEQDRHIAEKLQHIRKDEENREEQKKSEELYEELKKKGTLRHDKEKGK